MTIEDAFARPRVLWSAEEMTINGKGRLEDDN